MGWLEDSQSARRKEIEAEQQQQQQQKTDEKIDFLLRDHVQQPKKKERKPKLSNWIFPRLLPALHDDRFNIFRVCFGECTDGAGRDSARDLMYI